MGKIIYFFMCVVNPVKIRSFKKMPIFAALLIFVLQFFMVLLPSKLYINNHSDYSASIYDKTCALYNIKDSSNLSGFDNMKSTKLSVESGVITVNLDEVMVNEFTYYYNEENINVIIIFDTKEILDKKLEEFVNIYYEVYPSELDKTSKTRVNNICQLAYNRKINDELLHNDEEYIKEFHDKEDSELLELLMDVPYYKLYGVDALSSNKNYAYIFNKESILRITPDETDIFSYSFLDFDITKFDSLSAFCKDLSVQMIQKYNEQMFDYYLMFIVIYVLLLPILASVIMFVFTRKYKKLDSLFDYYKIASLVSIIPAITACIMSFAFGPGAKSVYIILFIIYSMLMLFKAATMEDSEEKK